MDAPFPAGMMADVERFFREVHPTLTPGQDLYDEVFGTEYFFPLQRKAELRRMMQIARRVCTCGADRTGPSAEAHDKDCGPRTVMEIGADKGGGLYHWCMCLPTVRNVIGCEIRGTPYRLEFERAFPGLEFCWTLESGTDAGLVMDWRIDREAPGSFGRWIPKIDVLFIDGDKLGMLRDFDAYLPMMRRPGGVVFMHDIQDHEPYHQFKAVMERGFRTEVILDKSEFYDKPLDWKPASNWEGWLKHWRGRSCGVGVIYL